MVRKIRYSLSNTKILDIGNETSVSAQKTLSVELYFLEVLEAFLYSVVLQIFVHVSCEIQTWPNCSVYSPKQAEKWLQVRETFHE